MFMLSLFRSKSLNVWQDLVLFLVLRDLRVRYRGSFFGYLWSMMNPLLYMAILSFVFSHLLRFQIDNFPLFILSGILVWNLFQQSIVIGAHSVIQNGALLKKVKVPAILFPVASVCSVLINFILALIPYVLIGALTGLQFSKWFFFLPVILIPFLGFILGLVLLVASLNVRYQDIGHMMDPLLTMCFYATPIIYPLSMLPEKYQKLLFFNPIAHYVSQMRHVLFDGVAPGLINITIIYVLALISLLAGGLVFVWNRDQFIYSL
jgi:ABC-type polysaccharide/polyol phosphate export permease